MSKLLRVAIICLLVSSSFAEMGFARTLYVVTRSTKVFRLSKRDFPSVGLFATRDRGQTWEHFGWHYTKCFSGATAVVNGQRVYYLACGNGVQKSPDGGQSWIITTGWNITECLKVAIDPRNSDVVYTASAYGIFKTADGGKTWQEKNRGLASTFTAALIIDPDDPETLYCATEAGVCRSRDGAEHWEPIGLLGLGVRTIVQHPVYRDMLAAGTEEDGVWLSSDRGTTWHPANAGLTHRTVYALAFAPQDDRTMYAGTFQGGVFKSEDGGASWRSCNEGLRVLDIHAVLVDPDDKSTVYLGTLNDGVWCSTDGGAHWHFIGLETSQVWDMFFE
ncbi:MAG: hypothetical protein H5U38_14240 [Calditrichaeota bacterium]|nr:hypothetical protein [Calditrichota bacterium]